MLAVSQATVRYGPVTALRNVTLDVEQGETIGILGPNGAGKTSLVHAIAGVLKPVAGEILFEGKRTAGMSPEGLARQGVALVPEGRRIWASLTVSDHLRLGATTCGKDFEAEVERVLARFPILRAMEGRQAGLLSGGEQQQLAIARALVGRPRLLILDEPSLGLAPMIVDALFGFLEELKEEGLTMIVVEQHTTRTIDLCDRAYVLRTGEVVLEGTSERLRGENLLLEAYLS